MHEAFSIELLANTQFEYEKFQLADGLLASCCTSMTSHIICDITTALLKYDKYIEKLKLTAQAVQMQITTIYIVSMCK